LIDLSQFNTRPQRRQPEVQMGERYKKILGALKEEELRKPDLIKGREKQRIAMESGEVSCCF
jgi:signal recognition particle GTPase